MEKYKPLKVEIKIMSTNIKLIKIHPITISTTAIVSNTHKKHIRELPRKIINKIQYSVILKT